MPHGGTARDQAIGRLLALLAVVSYATVNALLRAVAGDVDPFVGSLVRQVPLALVAAAALLVIRPLALRPGNELFIGPRLLALLVGAGVVSFVLGNVVMFQALDMGGLAVAAVGAQAGMAVGGTILSTVVLREPPSKWQLVGVVVVVIGLSVMLLSDLASEQGMSIIVGVGLSALSGACYTTANTASRYAQRRKGRFLTALALTNFGGIVVLLGIVGFRALTGVQGLWTGVAGPGLAFLIAAGLVNAVALASITLAVRYTSVTVVSMMQSLVLVLGVLVGWLVFDEQLSTLALTGAGVVVLGVILGQIRSRLPAVEPAPGPTPLEKSVAEELSQQHSKGTP